jgi:hypothetical protein
MNRYTAIIFLISYFFKFSSSAQTLTVSTGQLSFGNVYENAPDSMQLGITNNLGYDVTVNNIRFYNTYGSPAFSCGTGAFVISDNTTAAIWIRFSPRHNIFHNSEMIIENTGRRGAVSVDLTGQGKYSNTYYNLTENLSEENLKTVLGAITGNGYVSLGYNTARDEMFMTIDNKKVNGQGAAQNTLECVYTGRQAVGYTSRTDCQTNFSFNTEHTFPQTFFSSAEPMKSDLHHLFPTDDNANNQRGDNPFGPVNNPSWTNGGSSSDGITFEPRDLQKGVAARSLFYFVLRYQDYSNFVAPQESILRTWFQSFPVSSQERTRNSDIYSVQQNRNPFVDYPVFLERIQSITSNSVAPLNSSVDLSEDTMIYGTIQPNVPVTYSLVIVNNGNTSVNLTNFALTHPGELSFASTGNDTTIGPGDALTVRVQCLTALTDSIRAFLTFNTNASGHVNISIPVFVNDVIYSVIADVKGTSFRIFPNPASDIVTISSEGNEMTRWALTSITGETLGNGQYYGATTIDVGSYAKGIYLLKIFTNGEILNRKIIVQ